MRGRRAKYHDHGPGHLCGTTVFIAIKVNGEACMLSHFLMNPSPSHNAFNHRILTLRLIVLSFDIAMQYLLPRTANFATP